MTAFRVYGTRYEQSPKYEVDNPAGQAGFPGTEATETIAGKMKHSKVEVRMGMRIHAAGRGLTKCLMVSGYPFVPRS